MFLYLVVSSIMLLIMRLLMKGVARDLKQKGKHLNERLGHNRAGAQDERVADGRTAGLTPGCKLNLLVETVTQNIILSSQSAIATFTCLHTYTHTYVHMQLHVVVSSNKKWKITCIRAFFSREKKFFISNNLFYI